MKGPDGEVIPPRVIDKPPTAELRENQKDEDSLPPYADLDVMLEMLIDKEASVADVVAMGYDRETVKKIERLIYINEYKRFQSAPGTRLTERAFWLDRRYPIVNRWRDNTRADPAIVPPGLRGMGGPWTGCRTPMELTSFWARPGASATGRCRSCLSERASGCSGSRGCRT
jgi:hypothetical protein